MVLVCLSLAARAQDSTPTKAGVPSTGWNQVEALPAHSRVHVESERKRSLCVIDAVDSEKLTCSGKVYPRAEIKSIKLSRRSRSTLGGLALGLAVGAGAGAGIGSAINAGDKGNLFHVSGGKSAGVGAALGGALFGIVGGVVGYSTDIFAGPQIYRR